MESVEASPAIAEPCAQPPVIRGNLVRNPARKAPLVPLAFAVLLGASLALPLLNEVGFHFAVCPWRRGWGVPCLFCGSTRSLLALAQGDLAASASWNPLFFAACIVVTAGFFLWLIDSAFSHSYLERMARVLEKRLWAFAGFLATAAACNWLYLAWHLPP